MQFIGVNSSHAEKSYKVLSLVFLVASMMAITACNDSNDQQSTAVSPTPTDTRDQRFLAVKTNDVFKLRLLI